MSRVLTGRVVSDKNAKTIVVAISSRKTHPIYKKQYSVTKRFMAHDENNEAKVGDLVAISESRPLSANKRWKLDKIVEKARLSASDTPDAVLVEEEIKEEA